MTIEAMQRGFAMLVVGLFVGALGACDDQGPAEQAGEAIDNTAEEAGEAAEEAGDAVKDATN